MNLQTHLLRHLPAHSLLQSLTWKRPTGWSHRCVFLDLRDAPTGPQEQLHSPMSQKPASALYIPRGKDGCRPSRHRFPSDTRTITTGDIWRNAQHSGKYTQTTCQKITSLSGTGLDQSHLGIVDNAAAAADSLTSCLVAVGGMARGAAEAAGLMPPEQSLSLQHTAEGPQVVFCGRNRSAESWFTQNHTERHQPAVLAVQ